MSSFSDHSITQIGPSLLKVLGAEPAPGMAEPVESLVSLAQENGCDRVFMYNPDAIASWVYERFIEKFRGCEEVSALRLALDSVYPPVTPVCFASMYSGLEPAEHGIQKYEKPILRCSTVFDVLPKAGKRVAIVSTKGDSISEIFLGRNMDYYIYRTIEDCNDKAEELIRADRHDMIVLYNGNYDYWMHRVSPTGLTARRQLGKNAAQFLRLHDLIKECWKPRGHSTLLGFAPDHGCHRAAFPPGDHGIDRPCDMNIYHLYSFI